MIMPNCEPVAIPICVTILIISTGHYIDSPSKCIILLIVVMEYYKTIVHILFPFVGRDRMAHIPETLHRMYCSCG